MRHFYILLFWALTQVANAQIIIKPLTQQANTTARAAAVQNHTITLPFWDDFSTSIGKLDTTWWTVGSQEQVLIKPGIGIDPPSLGVATFDGVDALGLPYLPGPTDGGVDSLVSQYIDMTKVPTNLRNTVYLSFFYQFKGLGEAPEEEDSLTLYFKNNTGKWDKMWPTNPGDNYNTDPATFTEIFIKAADTKYYHSEFQFMFKASGRQNGWMDNWLVDYVYMDKRRSSTDNSYLDRAFTSFPSSIFDQYTAIPYDDFVAANNQNLLFTSTTTKLRNLENFLQPITYSVNLYDTLKDELVEKITANKALILFKNDLVDVPSKALDPALLSNNSDSLLLMLEYSVNSNDKFLVDSIYNNGADTAFYNHINLRQNDTLRSYFSLNNYYAYDDGTAEYAAGINQPLGSLAVQFEVLVGKYLNEIDIYFPNVQGVQSGTPLELFVLNDFEGNENSLLLTSNIAIEHTGINEFIKFKLPQPLFVTDTFFIGFTNLSSNQQWLAVGLDQNTDSSDKIFVNVDGTWVPNTTVKGSLMMRPHFTSETPILGIEDRIADNFKVYPNPSQGRLFIEGDYTIIRLVDVLGKPIPFQIISPSEISFTADKPKLLIVIIETEEGIKSHRIIVSPTP